MKPNYIEIIKEHNEHTILLDMDGMVKATDVCYELGKKEGHKEVLEWLSKMDYLSDNIQYIIQEWENRTL